MYISIPWSGEDNVDEETVDGPCAKRRCPIHSQENPLKPGGW